MAEMRKVRITVEYTATKTIEVELPASTFEQAGWTPEGVAEPNYHSAVDACLKAYDERFESTPVKIDWDPLSTIIELADPETGEYPETDGDFWYER